MLFIFHKIWWNHQKIKRFNYWTGVNFEIIWIYSIKSPTVSLYMQDYVLSSKLLGRYSKVNSVCDTYKSIALSVNKLEITDPDLIPSIFKVTSELVYGTQNTLPKISFHLFLWNYLVSSLFFPILFIKHFSTLICNFLVSFITTIKGSRSHLATCKSYMPDRIASFWKKFKIISSQDRFYP